MTNRLADAVSPYLRSHADNPVDWWPWGEEAFAEAARRDVPVMVSIGYATCHWCHVMARESFSDPEVAGYLNENFVAIKVDREEHPEVDASYLAAASAFTRHLGWPLTVFATPDGRTYFAGTYFPPRRGRWSPAFRQVLEAVLEAWTDRRAEVEAAGDAFARRSRRCRAIGDRDRRPRRASSSRRPSATLESLEDPEFGGFGRAPKFPNTPVLAFLLERGAAGDDRADAFARRTLATMAASGLRDPVEGGFFRYAVQRDWTEPHYERMLNDNAQLLGLPTRQRATKRRREGLAGFLLDVLRLPSGRVRLGAGQREPRRRRSAARAATTRSTPPARAGQPPPALDAKVLTGLNGIAIGALADAGVRFGRSEWIVARASRGGCGARRSTGRTAGTRPGVTRREALGCASRLSRTTAGSPVGCSGLSLATGRPDYAVVARDLVEACAVPDDGRSRRARTVRTRCSRPADSRSRAIRATAPRHPAARCSPTRRFCSRRSPATTRTGEIAEAAIRPLLVRTPRTADRLRSDARGRTAAGGAARAARGGDRSTMTVSAPASWEYVARLHRARCAIVTRGAGRGLRRGRLRAVRRTHLARRTGDGVLLRALRVRAAGDDGR